MRVRVRGLPPTADELQFIDRERITEAQKRDAQSLPDDPLICGVDVSGGGAAWTVCAFRRGGDARTLPRIRIPANIRAIVRCWWRNLPRSCVTRDLAGKWPLCSSIWPSGPRSMSSTEGRYRHRV